MKPDREWLKAVKFTETEELVVCCLCLSLFIDTWRCWGDLNNSSSTNKQIIRGGPSSCSLTSKKSRAHSRVQFSSSGEAPECIGLEPTTLLTWVGEMTGCTQIVAISLEPPDVSSCLQESSMSSRIPVPIAQMQATLAGRGPLAGSSPKLWHFRFNPSLGGAGGVGNPFARNGSSPPPDLAWEWTL